MAKGCGRCKFWNPKDQTCHRYPPKQLRSADAVFPKTKPTDYCGELVCGQVPADDDDEPAAEPESED